MFEKHCLDKNKQVNQRLYNTKHQVNQRLYNTKHQVN